VTLGKITLPAVKDCPLPTAKLPLIVVSHGRGGSFVGHHDTDEVLADAGFIVAAINHPGDTVTDLSLSGDLSIFVERPNHIARLIDFMVGPSPFAALIDQDRIGFFGFSRGGYTGLVLIGANPDWDAPLPLCQQSTAHICDQLRNKEFASQPLTHDPRIKAAVIVDPLSIMFTANSFAQVKVPVQLWASELGGDGVLPHSVDVVDTGLAPKHEYRVVSGGGHFGFLAPCPPDWIKELPEICVDTGGFDRIAFHKQFDADVLAFFRAQLTK
jgi:predicted dienelactone hydrolase